jgi:hypothetical protein
MKFDLSTIPPGAIVTSATLQMSLVGNDTAADNSYTIGAHKVTRKNPNVLKATGYSADGVVAWTANNCCQGVPLAQADISPAYDSKPIDKVRSLKTWTITTMVQEWLANPAGNMGMMLCRPRSRAIATHVRSVDTDATKRPILKVIRRSAADGGDQRTASGGSPARFRSAPQRWTTSR